MLVSVHPAVTSLRGDGRGYNPRDLRVAPLPGSRERISGVFRDDGVGATSRLNRPFSIEIPVGFSDWIFLNAQVFYALSSSVREIVIVI